MPIFISIADIRASAAHLRLSSSNSGLNTNAKPSPPADEGFELAKAGGKGDSDLEILPAEIKADTLDGEAQISAADYNPDDDRKLDDERRKVHDPQSHAVPTKQGVANGGEATKAEPVEVDEDEYEEVEEDVEDDDFDMFAVDDAPKKKRKVLKKKNVSVMLLLQHIVIVLTVILQAVQVIPKPAPVAATLVDNYDDFEGYYRITPGEILDDGRYQITVNLGKGMFAQVMRAKVLKPSNAGEKAGQEVAIKVIRSQESM
jgi:serine/threonine-protein kinase PRP4